MGGGPETPSLKHEYYVTNRTFHARKKREKFEIIMACYGKKSIKNGKHCMIGVTQVEQIPLTAKKNHR